MPSCSSIWRGSWSGTPRIRSSPHGADLSRLPRPARTLAERVKLAVALYPFDVLFVHRDAEREPHAMRVEEIRAALGEITLPAVCVVPVRMQEAWLLFDERAIRRAAGNPGGHTPLSLPRIRDLERLPDPKAELHRRLKEASGLAGRRLKAFLPHRATYLVGQYIDDFSPLRGLAAFKALEAEIAAVVAAHGW